MSKFNKKKDSHAEGVIAGARTSAAGKYTDEELLRRVTLCNLLQESAFYESADQITSQMIDLIPKCSPEFVANLATETRFEQKLRHTPIFLALSLYKYHKNNALCTETLGKICTRPDMTIDALAMLPFVMQRKKMKPVPNPVKEGIALAFNNYDYYQISKYKREGSEISLVDVVNLCHPKPNSKNKKALEDLVKGTMTPPDTWEVKLSQGKDKKATFTEMITAKKLGALATLRNVRGMLEAGVNRDVIIEGLDNVNSQWLTPLNFLAAARHAPQLTRHIDNAMKRSFASYRIPGTTIIALDVSGSMGGLSSMQSDFTLMDIGFALMATACYIFDDPILVYTAGNDHARRGSHMLAPTTNGLGIFENAQRDVVRPLGGGGIFTHQLCEWLKSEGLAKDAKRLVVICDSQDIDARYGSKNKPDTSPYDTSYIIDISHHRFGIKTGVWTAEINGRSDKIFHYIAELERSNYN